MDDNAHVYFMFSYVEVLYFVCVCILQHKHITYCGGLDAKSCTLNI